MPIYQIDGLTPVVPEESFVHPTAVLIGDVILGKGVYVGPNASLRGDFGRIVVKDSANIQDNCVMHGFPEQDTVVEEDGHIGHSAILHGCIIRRNALVGMNAVVIDGAVIGENSIVGASAFVKAKAEMPANYLIVGSPAKAIRELSEQELAWKKQGTHEYQVILMTESRAKELGLVPLGYLRSYAFTAIDVWQDMLLGPAWSTPLALERAGLTMSDLTLIDMHEAFAAQTLANIQLLGSERFARDVLGRAHATGEVDDSKFNVLGGSIAYGHPFAATGARMITQTLHELRRRGGGFGLVTACAAGGLGAAMVVEAE